jgi:hypothetical protein
MDSPVIKRLTQLLVILSALAPAPALAGTQKPLVIKNGQTQQIQSGDVLVDSDGKPYASPSGIIPGCAGNGTTDDTSCVQAALTATPAGGTLFTGRGLYKITSVLTVPGSVTVMGGGGSQGSYNQTCLAGFRTGNATQGAFVMGAGSKLIGVCIDTSVTKTAGTAISALDVNTVTIAESAIYNQFIGIDFSGEAGGLTANQAVKTMIRDNSIVPANNSGAIAIRIGVHSTLSNTTGAYVQNNYIVCQGGHGIGTLILDAGGLYMAGNNRYGCNIGTKIYPGTNQMVVWMTAGPNEILGDTDTTNDLLIDTADSTASIWGLQFVGAWTSYASGGSSALIQNTAGGSIQGLHFTGHRGLPGTNQIGFEVKAGKHFTYDSSVICATGGSTAPMMRIGGSTAQSNVTGNTIGNCGHEASGSIATGIDVTTTASDVGVISGNTITAATTAVNWAPSNGNNTAAAIGDNWGVDNVSPSVTSASTVTLPANKLVFITGTTTITTINGGWDNRQVQLYFPSGLSLNTGGNICSAQTAAAFSTYTLTYNQGIGCWIVK